MFGFEKPVYLSISCTVSRMFSRIEAAAASSSPLRSFTAAFLVSASAARYKSSSFFSAAVTLTLVLEEEVFLAEGFVLAEEPLAALSREDCVTPVALAISLSCVWVSSFCPRSAKLISDAESPLIFRASCSCVRSAAVRASLMSVPTFFAALLCSSLLYLSYFTTCDGRLQYHSFALNLSSKGV